MVLAKNQYQGITIGLTLPAAMVKLAASVPVALKRVEIYVKTHPPVSPFIKGDKASAKSPTDCKLRCY